MQTSIETTIGLLSIEVHEGTLRAIHFGQGPEPADRTQGDPQDQEVTERTVAQLEEYFRGERTQFDLPLAPQGTEFQKQAWTALCEIPFGETRSYREQAERIGRPTAMRAVGAANGKNPIPVIIPCHRVIGASGDLTGYAGGLAIKKALLALEGQGELFSEA